MNWNKFIIPIIINIRNKKLLIYSTNIYNNGEQLGSHCSRR